VWSWHDLSFTVVCVQGSHFIIPVLQESLCAQLPYHLLVLEKVLPVLLPVAGKNLVALAGILVALMAKVNFLFCTAKEISTAFIFAALADFRPGARLLFFQVGWAASAEYATGRH
jgi:hypothetical protein